VSIIIISIIKRMKIRKIISRFKQWTVFKRRTTLVRITLVYNNIKCIFPHVPPRRLWGAIYSLHTHIVRIVLGRYIIYIPGIYNIYVHYLDRCIGIMVIGHVSREQQYVEAIYLLYIYTDKLTFIIYVYGHAYMSYIKVRWLDLFMLKK